MYVINSGLTVLECLECGNLIVVDNDTLVEMLKDGQLMTEDELILTEVIDDLLCELDDECDGDCECCEFGF